MEPGRLFDMKARQLFEMEAKQMFGMEAKADVWGGGWTVV